MKVQETRPRLAGLSMRGKVVVEDGKRRVLRRPRFACKATAAIRRFFQDLGPFRMAVEASASYEWFLLLVDDLADRSVLAHPPPKAACDRGEYPQDEQDDAEAWHATPRRPSFRSRSPGQPYPPPRSIYHSA